MKNIFIIMLGKTISGMIKFLRLGNGSTWPGHLALLVNKRFLRELLGHSSLKIIIIAGTNGKTTSSRMLRAVLESDGKTVIHNESGANLLNGIASTLILASSNTGSIHADYAIFETDENALPQLLREITPSYILLLNLFRDQLDRYGEVDTIAKKWQEAIVKLPENTVIVANADDPKTAAIGLSRKNSVFFGLDEKDAKRTIDEYAVDSIHCPTCGTKLKYKKVFYSHLGDWLCPHCGLKHPDSSVSDTIKIGLSGTYNLSNAHGIIALTRQLGTREDVIANSLKSVTPAFGRQEKITVAGKKIQLFLSKNPTGFNESLRTIADFPGKYIMFVLNDRIADGKDVSWIWDIDMESYVSSFRGITVSGDRAFDMGLRLKYSGASQMKNEKCKIDEDLHKALQHALKELPTDETLYILPTYTAMLEVRKLLTGKKIL